MATILIVDDCQPTLLSLEHILRFHGYEVYATTSAEHAILIATTGKDIDLVITDFTMPAMTGHDLIDHVRSFRQSLPIILRTGAEIKERGKANVLLAKGGELTTLLAVIRELLQPVGGREYETTATSRSRHGGDQASQG